jgi:hypothetical protein
MVSFIFCNKEIHQRDGNAENQRNSLLGECTFGINVVHAVCVESIVNCLQGKETGNVLRFV